MYTGEIVYLPYKGGYIRYEIHKVLEDSLLVKTYKSDVYNWVSIDEVLTTDEFTKIYNNETIYE